MPFPHENSMRVLLARVSILSVCVLAVSAAPARGQSTTLTSMPLLMRVTSSFRPADGQPPAPVETMTLSIYGEETGGVPLWQERQMVAVKRDGRFTLLMGSTRPDGLPLDLFASGDPLWLALHVERPGEGEPRRVQLVIVPPVLSASDARGRCARAGSTRVAHQGSKTLGVRPRTLRGRLPPRLTAQPASKSCCLQSSDWTCA